MLRTESSFSHEKNDLIIENWGEVAYQDAASRQLEYVEQVANGVRSDTLIVCTHPPVVTLGRGTQAGDVFGWSGETVETSRGGRATYHGPNQIVIYPILNLEKNRAGFKPRDLHGYLRSVEQAIVGAVREFGIEAEARTIKVEDGPSLTGVWVGEQKIASIGIAVKKWVTYHGLAINVTEDARAFSGINPCGFKTSVMTSLESALSSKGIAPQANLRQKIQDLLVSNLQCEFLIAD